MLAVSDLMTVNPQTITPETSLRHIVELMKSEGCRHLPVLKDNALVGIVTDRDVRLVMNSPIVLHGRWQDEELINKVTAETCMTPGPITVNPDTPAYRAAEMLSIYKFGCLPVVEGDTLVGIVTVTDFFDYLATSKEKELADQQ